MILRMRNWCFVTCPTLSLLCRAIYGKKFSEFFRSRDFVDVRVDVSNTEGGELLMRFASATGPSIITFTIIAR